MKYDLDQPFLQPNEALKALQDGGDSTGLMVMQEGLKTPPFGEVWDEYGEFLFVFAFVKKNRAYLSVWSYNIA